MTTAAQRAKRQEFEELWSATVGVDVSAEDVALSCWDKELREAATRERLALKP